MSQSYFVSSIFRNYFLDPNFQFLFSDNHQEESTAALTELENIDTQADKVGIAFVKINDLELVSEFGLGAMPALVYYRHTTPIVYDGDITDEARVLDWLINNRNVGDDSERLEEVSASTLEGMTSTSEGIVVLFCKIISLFSFEIQKLIFEYFR